MDKANVFGIAQRYADEVKARFGANKIILFGSYAKGNYTPDSDIDIAVVMDHFDNPIDMQVALMHLTRTIDSRIEPHPFTEEDFEPSNPLAYEVMRYGQVLK